MKTSPGDGHCEKLLAQLSAYIDDELPSDECRRLVEHLEACPDCEELVEDLKRTAQLCAAERSVLLTADVRARARARIRQLLAELPSETDATGTNGSGHQAPARPPAVRGRRSGGRRRP